MSRKCPKCKGAGVVEARTPSQIGKSNRRRGAGGELEAAKLLGLERSARIGKSAGDLVVPDGYAFSLEIKKRKKTYGHLYGCLAQAESYAPEKVPVLVARDDRSSWILTMRLSDAVRLIPGLRVEEK